MSSEQLVAGMRDASTRDVLRQFARRRLVLASVVVLSAVVVAALAAPLIAPYDPTAQNASATLRGPSIAHWLGTDDLGRDTLSRVIYGARASLSVGFIAVGIALVLGGSLGLIAGYSRGVIETVIMRAMDGLLGFPALVLALAITGMLGPSLSNAMIAVGVTGVPAFARLVRGQVLAVRDLEYIQASHAIGAGPLRIMLRHMLPNIMSPVIVQASIAMPTAILAEAALSFLGLGVQPPTPSWGAMLNTARGYLDQDPWLVVGPGVAILVTVLALNFLGDALRDALDPRSR